MVYRTLKTRYSPIKIGGKNGSIKKMDKKISKSNTYSFSCTFTMDIRELEE